MSSRHTGDGAPRGEPGARESKVDWVGALEDRAGPLAEVARRFVRRHAAGEGPSFPRGPGGLARLAAVVDAWCEIEEPGEEADRRFVEGAGALLGLLLIDHFGEGAFASRDGVHRVRVGRRGFVDPFAILESVLDAEDPRAALGAELRRAEAEARGEGAVSRVVTAFERCLHRDHPGLGVREHFEAYLRLDSGVEVDLSRAIAATRDEPQGAVEQAVGKLVAMLPGGQPAAMGWEEARSRLLPRLVGEAFLHSLRGPSGAHGQLWATRVGHDAWLTLILAYGDRARYVRDDEVRRWGADGAAASRPTARVRRAAMENLAARSGAACFAEVQTDAGPLVVARSGDGLDAARLLLPGLFEVLRPTLGRRILLAVPHRDALFACGADRPEATRALRLRARDEARRAPHRITEDVFTLAEEGLAPG